jgi:N-acetylglucosaminyl-diphospho-decaprenol L-rhamnosyltransferase
MRITIVIPLYNQLKYTRLCLDSLRSHGTAGAQLLLIDNGSADGTAEYLAGCAEAAVIANPENLGCAGAWNQGVRAAETDWVLFLNNDVLVSPGWLEGLLAFAEEGQLDVVSPAIREGEYNYDIVSYAREFVARMAGFARLGVADGICFMVRRQVFATIGLFDEKFRIGQFEDADFFRRAKAAGFRLGTTGRSFIHHFGSVTQDSIRKSKKVRPYEAENRAYYRQKWQLSWWRRFREKRLARWRELGWRTAERLRQGHTLKEKWLGGRLRYF